MNEPSAVPGERLPWMPLYCDDFLASNLVARIGEVWSWRYVLLLMRAWTEPAPCFLPNDDTALLRLMGAPETDRMTAEFQAIREKFVATQDGAHLYHRKQLAVYRKAQRDYLASVDRGKKGAEARWRPAILPVTQPAPASPEAFNAAEAAKFVCDTLNLAGTQWLTKMRDVVTGAVRAWGCAPEQAAERLVARWREYEKSGEKYKVGIRRFFEDGKWEDAGQAAPKRRYLNEVKR